MQDLICHVEHFEAGYRSLALTPPRCHSTSPWTIAWNTSRLRDRATNTRARGVRAALEGLCTVSNRPPRNRTAASEMASKAGSPGATELRCRQSWSSIIMNPPRPPTARPPEGAFPHGHVARRRLSEGALAAPVVQPWVARRERTWSRHAAVPPPCSNSPARPSSFEVARVLLWGPGRCAGAPAPSGFPPLRSGCHACSRPGPVVATYVRLAFGRRP